MGWNPAEQAPYQSFDGLPGQHTHRPTDRIPGIQQGRAMPPAAPAIAPPPRKVRPAGRPRSVIIIGAGPGGLAAALLLGRAGLNVRVVERLPRVGGRCSAVEADGFRFDLGPTFFLYPQVLERIFRLVGRDLHKQVPMVRLDPQYRVVFGPAAGT